MTASIRLGRVWGIPIGLHWSLLLVFGLLVVSLAGGYFPAQYPDMPPAARLPLAVVTSLLFFASIVLHELGHARIALREGIPVNGITLFIFGGVAEIGASAETPGAEFRIALGGPVVSLVLGLFFLGLSQLDRGISMLAAPTEWLARVNLLLLAFNLIPGYPLDGGRVMRAIVWRLTGSEQTGWKAAMVSGQIVSFGLMGWGAWMVFGGDFANGIWLIFIGWFLQNATAAEQASHTVQRQLAGTTVRQAMGLTEEPRVPSRAKIQQVVDDYVLDRGFRYFLVEDGDTPRGVATLADFAKTPRDKWSWTSIADVMTPWASLARVNPSTPLLDALQMMESGGYGQLPVVEGDHLVGLLTREEILKFLRLRAQVGPAT